MNTVNIDINEYIMLINYKLAGIHQDKKESFSYFESKRWKPEEDRLKNKLKELQSLK